MAKNYMPRRNGGKTAPAVKAAKQAIVNMLNARRELKYFESTTTTTITTAGAILNISQGIVQGDSSVTRDGDTINMAQLLIHFKFTCDQVTVKDSARLIIFTDFQANGIYPTITGGTTGLLLAASPYASYDFPVAIRHRFKVLHDEILVSTVNGSNYINQYTRKINLQNHSVNYLGATNAQASNGKGAIYALVVGESNASSYILNVAMKFYDS